MIIIKGKGEEGRSGGGVKTHNDSAYPNISPPNYYQYPIL